MHRAWWGPIHAGMRRTAIATLFLFFATGLYTQTVVTDTSYTTSVLECLSDYVSFPDGQRYFAGLVVKQGTRLYYLDHPYRVEVIGNRLTFDDFDTYTDRVSVDLGRTYYPDLDSMKSAAVACLGMAGLRDTIFIYDTTYISSGGIDSISYYGDTLYVYEEGNPIPYTTYIDSCPCEEAPPEPECVYVLGNPDTGEVVGDPDTGVVLFVQNCPGGMALMQKKAPASGAPPPETMLAANCREP